MIAGFRDMKEYRSFCNYIHQNPVKRRLVAEAGDYPYSSAYGRFVVMNPSAAKAARLSI